MCGELLALGHQPPTLIMSEPPQGARVPKRFVIFLNAREYRNLLAANHRHATVCTLEPFVTNIVFQLFIPDGMTNGSSNRFVICSRTDDGP